MVVMGVAAMMMMMMMIIMMMMIMIMMMMMMMLLLIKDTMMLMMLMILMMLMMLMMLMIPTRIRWKKMRTRMQIWVELLLTTMEVVTRRMMTQRMYRALPHPARCVIIGFTIGSKYTCAKSKTQGQWEARAVREATYVMRTAEAREGREAKKAREVREAREVRKAIKAKRQERG
jgi:hypothetical protein